MKKNHNFLIVLLLLCLPINGQGQPCQEVKFYNDQQRITLVKYIEECIQGRHFIGDKGVVHLNESKDSQGRLVWMLQAVVDDRYKDSPPTQWASLNGDIILIYGGDHAPTYSTAVQKEEVLACLKAVIQDRLYIRPPKEDVWVNVEEKPGVPVLHAVTGKPLRIKRMRLIGGSVGNAKKIIFNSDGTQTILKSV